MTSDCERLPWRVGNHYGIHVYEGDRPDSRPVATFHREEDARRCVEAVNHSAKVTALCRCGHNRDAHGLDRKRRPICRGNTMCGCAAFREPMPAGWDERYDPSPEPIDRRTR